MTLPAIVNRIPPGLLTLLGLKSTGRNPSAFAEQLQGVVEMRDWYLASAASCVNQNGTVANSLSQVITGAPTLQVPDTEWWYLHYGSASFIADGGFVSPNRFAGQMQWTVYGIAQRGEWVEQSSFISAQVTFPSPRDLWLPPGSVASLRIDATAAVNPGAGAACALSAYVTRLSI